MNRAYGLLLFCYHLMWTLGSAVVLPLALVSGRKRLRGRFALNLPGKAIQKGSIWIHALSVGEVISAFPLVDRLVLGWPEIPIVFTVSTEKGMAVARSNLEGKVRLLLTMPVDAWWAVRRMIRYIRPSLFVLVETDIWPALLDALRRRGVTSLLVNGRVSPGTDRSYRRASFFVRNMLSSLDWCLMQSDLDCQRLLRVGVDVNKVKRLGNMKYDRKRAPMTPVEREDLRAEVCLDGDHFIWVAGSTHPGEDEILLRVHGRLLAQHPRLRLILAPRQVERGKGIVETARRLGLAPLLRTNIPTPCRDYQVLVLNTLGELERFYGLGGISFVGGSLVPAGGHNLLEPASFGCPVLFGPHTHNFVDMSRAMVAEGGGWRVKDEESLYGAVMELLMDGKLRAGMGERARRFVEDNRGAVEKVFKYMSLSRG